MPGIQRVGDANTEDQLPQLGKVSAPILVVDEEDVLAYIADPQPQAVRAQYELVE